MRGPTSSRPPSASLIDAIEPPPAPIESDCSMVVETIHWSMIGLNS